MPTRLTEIANKHGTDKGTTFNIKHGYTETYPTYIPENVDKILEIGVRFGPSIRMWNEYYPEAKIIYGLDYCVEMPVLTLKSIQEESPKYKFFVADQSNREHLDYVSGVIGEGELDFILDDGSHYVDHQQISLARLFKNIKPGGIYMMEDLADQYYPQGGWNIKDLENFTDVTVNVLDKFNKTGKFESPYLTKEENEYLESAIDKIILELRQDNNLAFIYKK